MKIRTKLTLIFFCIVTIILFGVSLSIYFFSADHREADFYARLRNKAENTAKILIDVDEIDSDLLKRIEKNNPSNLPNERIAVYNSNNEEVYNSDAGHVVPVTQELMNKIRRQNEVRFHHADYEVLGFIYRERGGIFVVVTAATDVNGFEKLTDLQEILWIVFGASLVFVSILGWFYAGRVLAPLSTIVADVDTISITRMNLRLDEGNKTDELAKLSQTFNKMLDRLEVAFIGQQNFIANASHELRTPITAIVGEIDVTLMQDRPVEKYVSVLHSISEEITNLNVLSNQLLLLAQASTDNPQQRFSPIRVDEILWQAKEDLKKAHPGYAVQIELDLMLNDDHLEINGDEQLMKAAFSNLMDNGCKYSEDGQVMVKVKGYENSVMIEFSNDGIGITKGDLESIFEPFFRGNNINKLKGHGIGLSLVKKIISLHRGNIVVHSTPGNNTKFTVVLPVAFVFQ